MASNKDIDLVAVADVVTAWFNKTIKDLQDNLDRRGSDTTYKLRQSIAENLSDGLEITAGSVYASISLEHYYEQVDQGRKRGSMPPVRDIRKWINDKGIGSNDKERDGIAWAIAKKIAAEGTKGNHFYSDVMNTSSINKLEKDINEAAGQDIEDLITNRVFKGATKR